MLQRTTLFIPLAIISLMLIVASEALVSIGAPKVEATAESALKISGKAVDVEGMNTNIKGNTVLALN